MKPHNDWESLMKDKWESQAVEFNEQHWKAMEAMLDRQPIRKPKAFAWGRYRWALLLLLLVPFAWWLGSYKNSTTTLPQTAYTENQTQVAKPPVLAPEKNTLKTEIQTLNQPTKPTQIPHNVDIKPNTTSFSFKNNPNKNLSPLAVPSPQSAISTHKIAEPVLSGQDKKTEVAAENLTDKTEKAQKKEAAIVENVVDKKVEIGRKETELKIFENQVVKSEMLKEKHPQPSTLSTLTVEDSKIGLQPVSGGLPMQPTVGHTPWRRSGLEVFSGISLQNQSYTVSPTATLRYHYALARRLSVQLSAAYAIARDFPNIVKETNQISYGLGFENTAYRLTTKSLHFAELGMGLRVPVMRSEFFGGFSYARLIYASATMQTIESNSFGLKGIKSENVSGYTLGLRKNDLQFYAGYGIHLSRRLKWQLSAHYGTRDLTDNTYFAQPDFHRNIQIRTGLAWRLK